MGSQIVPQNKNLFKVFAFMYMKVSDNMVFILMSMHADFHFFGK